MRGKEIKEEVKKRGWRGGWGVEMEGEKKERKMTWKGMSMGRGGKNGHEWGKDKRIECGKEAYGRKIGERKWVEEEKVARNGERDLD